MNLENIGIWKTCILLSELISNAWKPKIENTINQCVHGMLIRVIDGFRWYSSVTTKNCFNLVFIATKSKRCKNVPSMDFDEICIRISCLKHAIVLHLHHNQVRCCDGVVAAEKNENFIASMQWMHTRPHDDHCCYTNSITKKPWSKQAKNKYDLTTNVHRLHISPTLVWVCVCARASHNDHCLNFKSGSWPIVCCSC